MFPLLPLMSSNVLLDAYIFNVCSCLRPHSPRSEAEVGHTGRQPPALSRDIETDKSMNK